MKKFVSGLAILLALSLVTCEMSPLSGEVEYTNVVYELEGNTVKKVTILLNDVVPVTNQSRAISQSMAMQGLELFEVVFTDNETSGTVVRASWNWNRSVVLNGIVRDLDYTSNDVTEADGSAGAAILFAGRSNGTLLAVGKLYAVNDDPATKTIRNSTRSVTFGLAPLEVGDITLADVTGKVVKAGAYISVPTTSGIPDTDVYVFDVTAAAIPASFTVSSPSLSFPFADMSKGIIVRAGSAIVKEDPKLQLLTREYIKIPTPLAAPFSGAVGAAIAANNPFPSTGAIPITLTAGAQTGVNSFYFQIPVIALIDEKSFDGLNAPAQWYIRAGYDFAYLAQTNRTGACVLVEVVDVASIAFNDKYSTDLVPVPPLEVVEEIDYSLSGILVKY